MPSARSGGALASRARTVGTLALLQVPLPFTLVLTAVALARSLALPPLREVAKGPRPILAKTILLSGGKMTKSLQLARSFHRAGHRVVMVESARYRLTGHRFSRAVDRFHVVPEPWAPDYAEALLEIVLLEGVDVYVPVCSPASSRYDAHAATLLAPHCEVVHVDADRIDLLDDKHEFSVAAEAAGLPVPAYHRITDPQQVVDFDFEADGRTYILKSIAYDPVRRLDLTRLPRPTAAETAAFARSLPISEETPWIMQELVTGKEYCTHGTVRDGELQVYACCESSASQVNYAMVEMPEIESWVRTFVKALRVTGQASFDFIRSDDGRVLALECNPRTHSAITMFYDHPGLARGYLEDGVPTMVPTETSRPTYWLFHELWRMLRHPATAPERLAVTWNGKEAIFDWSDPLPFLMVHHLHIPSLLVDNLRHGRDWLKIDFNIGKLVEPAGD